MIIGKHIIIAGCLVVLIGIIIYYFGDKLNWLGRLPGDIRIESENLKIYFPIVTMLLLSLLLNIVIWLYKKYFS